MSANAVRLSAAPALSGGLFIACPVGRKMGVLMEIEAAASAAQAGPWTAITAALSVLAVAVSGLAYRVRRRSSDDDGDDGLSSRIAVLASSIAVLTARLDRAERDIANDKQGRQAFADAFSEIKVMAATQSAMARAIEAQEAAMAKAIEGFTATQVRQSANLDRVHTRIDDLHHAIVAQQHPRLTA
ncbi:hypothetical protein [Nitrospirillum iridis]|uniref:Uncharacterized protein n=1 Tax=Nitrospirillum iridis TaxID=765888 RepID=A0A7X0AXB0_9PROT|nr:hypothetical protein [Nitrospirillum iridis]MBB6251447.1 hypothetical protein [Nitrospirillum iridis]